MESNDSMLRKLSDILHDLSSEELSAVVAFVERQRAKRNTAAEQESRRPALPWDEFDRAHGVIALGGDALEDCAALYDDE